MLDSTVPREWDQGAQMTTTTDRRVAFWPACCFLLLRWRRARRTAPATPIAG